MKGSLITFEGIDFSGKTLQANLLANTLQKKGFAVELFRDPGGTSISEKIRDFLLDKKNKVMAAKTELLLYEASRTQLVTEKIVPALARGKIVICDRFFDSTTAYQGYGRGLELELIRRANEIAIGDIIPDLTFLLDLTPQEALKRKAKMGDNSDRMEEEELAFHRRVREGYLEMARQEPERFVVLRGEKSREELQHQIWQIVCERLGIS